MAKGGWGIGALAALAMLAVPGVAMASGDADIGSPSFTGCCSTCSGWTSAVIC